VRAQHAALARAMVEAVALLVALGRVARVEPDARVALPLRREPARVPARGRAQLVLDVLGQRAQLLQPEVVRTRALQPAPEAAALRGADPVDVERGRGGRHAAGIVPIARAPASSAAYPLRRMPRLFLLDGAALAYRAHFALQRSGLSTPEG